MDDYKALEVVSKDVGVGNLYIEVEKSKEVSIVLINEEIFCN